MDEENEKWYGWSLNDERKFLDGLGTWSGDRPKPRRKLLRNYIKAMAQRERRPPWFHDAVAYARELLYGKPKDSP